jgi:hypothetical protein
LNDPHGVLAGNCVHNKFEKEMGSCDRLSYCCGNQLPLHSLALPISGRSYYLPVFLPIAVIEVGEQDTVFYQGIARVFAPLVSAC